MTTRNNIWHWDKKKYETKIDNRNKLHTTQGSKLILEIKKMKKKSQSMLGQK